jgi:Glycosyltransferase family 87
MVSADHARSLLLVARDGLLFGLPILPYVVMAGLYRNGTGGVDLHVFWSAAHSVAHGVSPYDPAAVAHARTLVDTHPRVEASRGWAVYPPAVYAVLIPLGLLPWHVAAAIAIAGIAAAGFLALRVMGVRDWRCYFVAFGSVPFAMSLLEGTISTGLMLATALVWRGRVPVAATATALVAKLFVWPLVFVVAALHGIRRAALLLASAVFAALASWAIIGFADLLQYPKLLSDLSASEARLSFSLSGLFYALGASPELGQYVGLLLGLALSVLAFRLARSGLRDAAFTIAIVAALLASPIVWTHYFVLIFLPLAARAPRFNALWLAPLPMWLGSPLAADGRLLPFLVTWPCLAIIVLVALRPMLGDTSRKGRLTLVAPRPIRPVVDAARLAPT